jgi:ferredoxin-like protein FixX
MTCVDTCSGLQYRLAYNNTVSTTRKCVAMCPSSPVFYADEQTRTCVTKCANETYLFFNNSYRGCVKVCPAQVYTTTHSVDLYADNTTWRCVSVCPLGYFALKHPTNTSIRLCVKMCEVIGGVYYFS